MLRPLLTALATLLLLAACSPDRNPPGGNRPLQPKTQSTPKKGPSIEERTAGMVAAVSLGKSTVPVELKFALGSRPALAHPLEIQFALMPKSAADVVSVRIADSDGFEVPDGGGQFDMPEVLPGAVYLESLTVTPTKTGILVLSLDLTMKHDEIVEARTFSVPIIVTEAAAVAAAPRSEAGLPRAAPK